MSEKLDPRNRNSERAMMTMAARALVFVIKTLLPSTWPPHLCKRLDTSLRYVERAVRCNTLLRNYHMIQAGSNVKFAPTRSCTTTRAYSPSLPRVTLMIVPPSS